MRSTLDPFQFVVIAVAGWMNQHQQQVVGSFRHQLLLGRQSPSPTSEGDLRG